MEIQRPTLINVAGMDPLAWRVTFTAGPNITLVQDQVTRTILISGTLMTGDGGTSVTITADSSFPDQPLIAMSRLGRTSAAITNTGQDAHFVYVGYWPAGIVFKYVEGQIINQASANSPAEIGLFSSTSAPNKTSQTLTSIIVATLVTNLTAPGGIFRNVEAFTVTLSSPTFVWCGFRTNIPTDPRPAGLFNDFKQGHVLHTPIAGGGGNALTSTTSWLTTFYGTSEPQAPDIRATMI